MPRRENAHSPKSLSTVEAVDLRAGRFANGPPGRPARAYGNDATSTAPLAIATEMVTPFSVGPSAV